MYQVTLDEKWLERCKKMTDYCIKAFHDADSGMFFFSSREASFVVRRTLETSDNVIPASNSIMAGNLMALAAYFPGAAYAALADRMLPAIKHFQNHANWIRLLLQKQAPFYEVVIMGREAKAFSSRLQSEYLPNALFAGGEAESSLPLTQQRAVPGKTLIYVCEHGSCKLPVDNAGKALSLIIP